MTETRGPIQRYLCGVVYLAAGLAMAISAANGLSGNRPGIILQLVGGLAVAIAGGAVVRECRRQGQLAAAIETSAPAVDRPAAAIRMRGAAVEEATFRRVSEAAMQSVPLTPLPMRRSRGGLPFTRVATCRVGQRELVPTAGVEPA